MIFLVGTLHTSEIDDMVNFMKKKIQVPLSEVIFDVFQLENGQRSLVREITERYPHCQARKRNTEKLCND